MAFSESTGRVRAGVAILIGLPLLFAAAIFLSVIAFFVFSFIYGAPTG